MRHLLDLSLWSSSEIRPVSREINRQIGLPPTHCPLVSLATPHFYTPEILILKLSFSFWPFWPKYPPPLVHANWETLVRPFICLWQFFYKIRALVFFVKFWTLFSRKKCRKSEEAQILRKVVPSKFMQNVPGALKSKQVPFFPNFML